MSCFWRPSGNQYRLVHVDADIAIAAPAALYNDGVFA